MFPFERLPQNIQHSFKKKVKVKSFGWLYFEPKSEENHVTPMAIY